MPRASTKTMTSTPKTRVRRSEDQRIADLEAKIEQIRMRAATKAAKKDPALRHLSKAIRAIDAALTATTDNALRIALQEARVMLNACLQLQGVPVSQSGRSAGSVDAKALHGYVRSNPGQRGEQIAAALGTDTKALRAAMKRLIGEQKIKTKGERRGMQYFAT